jgi:hypothetical protein
VRVVYRSKKMDKMLDANGRLTAPVKTFISNVALQLGVVVDASMPGAWSAARPKPTKEPTPRPTVMANALPPQKYTAFPTPAPNRADVALLSKFNARRTRTSGAASVSYAVSSVLSTAFGQDASSEAEFRAGRVANSPQTGRVFVSFSLDSALITAVKLQMPLQLSLNVLDIGAGNASVANAWRDAATLDLFFVGIFPTQQPASSLWSSVSQQLEQASSTDGGDRGAFFMHPDVLRSSDATALGGQGVGVRTIAISPTSHAPVYARLAQAAPSTVLVLSFASADPSRDLVIPGPTLPAAIYGFVMGSSRADYSLVVDTATDWKPAVLRPIDGLPWASNVSSFSLSAVVLADRWSPLSATNTFLSLGDERKATTLALSVSSSGAVVLRLPSDVAGSAGRVSAAGLVKQGVQTVITLQRSAGSLSVLQDGNIIISAFTNSDVFPASQLLYVGADLRNWANRLFGTVELVKFRDTTARGRPLSPSPTPVPSMSRSPTGQPTWQPTE